MTAFLTKSNFMSGLQCHKKLWLEAKTPHQAIALTPAQQRIIDQGEKVGRYARRQFSEGQLIDGSGIETVQATQKAIGSPLKPPVYIEAAFSFDNLFIRCDILHKTPTDNWELIEVKSSSKVKDEHLWDVAVQKNILTRTGLSVSSTKLMHINTQTCF